jgi:cytochrome c556
MLAAVVLAAQQRDLDPVMKEVGPANTALNAAAAGNVAADVATNAAKLQTLFTETEAFMKSKNATKGAELAREAAAHASEAAKAAKGGNLDAAKAAAGKVKGTCKGCHEMFREKDPAGGFKFKGGA